MTIRFFAGALICALIGGAALADDVSDAIGEAAKAYEAGNLAGAKSSLDLAAQLVAQKQADGLAKFLPEPPAGWTAEPPDATAAGAAFLGGGLVVKRTYEKDGKRTEIQLMANSPVLSSMAPMFSNVSLLGSLGRVFRQKGRPAIATSENEIQMVAGKTYLTMSGDAAEADKKALLDLVDIAGLEKFGS